MSSYQDILSKMAGTDSAVTVPDSLNPGADPFLSPAPLPSEADTEEPNVARGLLERFKLDPSRPTITQPVYAEEVQSTLASMEPEDRFRFEAQLFGNLKEAAKRNFEKGDVDPDTLGRVVRIMKERGVGLEDAKKLEPDLVLTEDTQKLAEFLTEKDEEGNYTDPELIEMALDPLYGASNRLDLKAWKAIKQIALQKRQEGESRLEQLGRAAASSVLVFVENVNPLGAFGTALDLGTGLLSMYSNQSGAYGDSAISSPAAMWKAVTGNEVTAEELSSYKKLFNTVFSSIGLDFERMAEAVAPQNADVIGRFKEGDYFGALQDLPITFVESVGTTMAAASVALRRGDFKTAGDMLFKVAAGEAYDEGLEEGKSASERTIYALASGAAEKFYETYGTLKILEDATGLKDFGVKSIASFVSRAAVRGGTSEGLTTATQTAADFATGDKEAFDQFGERMALSILMGALGDPVLGAPVAVGARFYHLRNSPKAVLDAEVHDGILESAGKISTKDALPDAFRSGLARVLKGAKTPASVSVGADKVAALFQNDDQLLFGFAESVGLTREQMQQAVEKGAEITVPYPSLVAATVKDPKLSALRDDIRFAPDQQTVNEVKAEQLELQEQLAVAREILASPESESAELRERLSSFRESLRQFKGEGGRKFTPEEINTYSALFAAMAKTAAAKRGITVNQWMDMVGLSVNTKSQVVVTPDGKIAIVPETDSAVTLQQSATLKADAQGQREFFKSRMQQAGYKSLNEVPPDEFNAWAQEWRSANPRTNPQGQQLFQMPEVGVPSARRVVESIAGDTVRAVPPSYFRQRSADRAQTAVQSRIASAYSALPVNDLKNERVKKAYSELKTEVVAQYQAMVASGVKVEVYESGEPYANAAEMRRDVEENNHLYVLKTDADTFGPGGAAFKGHPMLERSGLSDANGTELLVNDVFRAVHDYIAHAAFGSEFGPAGEEAAWRAHVSTLRSPWARWALTSETRGQNSWVNFRPQFLRDGLPIKKSEPGYTALKDRGFAEQKAALLPPEFMLTGTPEVDSVVLNDPEVGSLVREPVGLAVENAANTNADGFTLNHRTGELIPLGPKLFSVAVAPDVSTKNNGGAKDPAKWGRDLADMLLKAPYFSGGWKEGATGDYWLDLVIVTPDERFAEWLATRTNQKAVFKFENGGEIDTKGNGEDPGNLGPLDTRIEDLIAEYMAQGNAAPELYEAKSEDPYAGVTKGQLVSTSAPGGERTTDQTALTGVSLAEIQERDPKFTERSAKKLLDLRYEADGSGSELGLVINGERLKKSKGYFQVRPSDKAPDKLVEEFIGVLKDNILHVFDAVPESIREQTRHWYIGANRLAGGMAEEFGVSIEQAAGVIAALSPQKDWDQNVSLARRVLGVMKNPNAKVSKSLVEYAVKEVVGREIFGKTDKELDEQSKREREEEQNEMKRRFGMTPTDRAIALRAAMAEIPSGTRIRDIKEPNLRAILIRAYDQKNNDRGYQIHSPDGKPVRRAMRAVASKGKTGIVSYEYVDRVAAWGTLSSIKQAASIAENGDLTNISNSLGQAHKLRNFYNNIADPSDPRWVTIDTHAVAVGVFEPVAGTAHQVSAALGGSGSVSAGVKGLYALYAEAYFRAAKERGVLPREMQSVTWDAIRTLFPSELKTTLYGAIENVWLDYHNGKINADEVRKNVTELAGGFRTPEWAQTGGDQRKSGDLFAAGAFMSAPSGLKGDTGMSGYELVQHIDEKFGRLAKALKTEIVPQYAYRSGGSAHPARYVWSSMDGDHFISINPADLAANYSLEKVEAVIRHELVHAAIGQVLRSKKQNWTEFNTAVYNAMTPLERAALTRVYKSTNSKQDVGAEFVRAVIQRTVWGKIDEEVGRRSKALGLVLDLVVKAQRFLRRIARSTVADRRAVREVIDEATRIIKNAEKAGRVSSADVLFQSDEQTDPDLPEPADPSRYLRASRAGNFVAETRVVAERIVQNLPTLSEQDLQSLLKGQSFRAVSGSNAGAIAWIDGSPSTGGTVLKVVGDSEISFDPKTVEDAVNMPGVLVAETTAFSGNEGPQFVPVVEQMLHLNQFESGVKTKFIGRTEIREIAGHADLLVVEQTGVDISGGPVFWESRIEDLVAERRAVPIRLQLFGTNRIAYENAAFVAQAKNGQFYLLADIRHKNVGADDTGAVRVLDAIAHPITKDMIDRSDVLENAVSEILNEQQDLPYFQETAKPRGAVVLNKGDTVIHLFETANLSTLLHEMGHLFVNDLEDMVRSGLGGSAAAADLATLRKFVGAKKKGKLTREQHEKLARAFEAYLREGKAPSVGLVGAFRSFKSWLTAIYRTVAGLNVTINDEVRAVFDRMIAAEQDIDAAREFYKQKGDLLDLLNLDEIKRQELKAKAEALRAQQIDRQVAKYLRAYIRALGGVDELDKEARVMVNEIPVYRAVRKGLEAGIDAVSVVNALGDEAADILNLNFPGLVREDGAATLTTLALENGFESPEALASAIRDAKPIDDMVDSVVKETVSKYEQAIRADLAAKGATEADGTTHNDASLEYLAAETQLLKEQAGRQKRVSPARVSAAAFRSAAVEFLRTLPIRRAANYSLFAQRERSLALEVMQAAKAGDWTKAEKLRNQQLLQHALVLESIAARDARSRIENRFTRKKIKTLLEKVEFQYRPIIQTILSNYGFYDAPETPVELASVFKALDEDGSLDALIPDWIKAGAKATKSPGNLTLGEWQQIEDAVLRVAAYGRDALLSLRDKELQTVQEFVDKSVERMDRLKDHAAPQEGDAFFRLKKFWEQLKADVAMVRFVSNAADYFTKGPVSKLYDRLIQAELEQRRLMASVVRETDAAWRTLSEAVRRIEKEQGGKYFDLPDLPLPKAMALAGKGQWTGERLVAALLNLGNAGNKKALQAGYLFEDGFEVALSKHFTAAEIKAVQSIWRATDRLFPMLDDAHFRIFNTRLDKVASEPVLLVDKDGQTVELDGGYYPLMFDHEINAKAGRINEEDIMKNRAGNVFRKTTPKDGMTKSRVGSVLPPNLSLNVWLNHIEDTSRYITHSETARDWNRITSDERWRESFVSKFGWPIYNELRAWLKFQAVPKSVEAATAGKDYESAFEWLRVRGTQWTLGLNFKSGALQRTALVNAAAELGGWKWIIAGYRSLGISGTPVIGTKGSPEWQAIIAEDPYLSEREENLNLAIKEAVGQAKPGAKKFKVPGSDREFTMRDVRDFSFFWIRMNDRALVSVVWKGAYQKYMQEKAASNDPVENHKAAVAFAREVIQRTQPSSLNAEMNAFSRSRGVVKLFSVFMTYTMLYGNRLDWHARAYREGQITTADYVRHVTHEWLLEPWLRALLYAAMGGVKLSIAALLLAPLETFLSWIPIVRDVPRLIAMGRGPLESAKSPSALSIGTQVLDKPVSSGVKVGKDLATDGDLDNDLSEFALSLTYAVAFAAGVPVRNVVRDLTRAYDMITGGEDE